MGTTGIVTVLFTDLVGSTEMLARLGEEQAEALRLSHFALLREAIGRTHGTEVKNLGDGLMVTFAAASDAVGCGIAIQQALERHNRRAGVEALHVRIGVAVGEAICEESDYFGAPVVEAARLCERARGGQILVTEMVRMMAGSRGGWRFESLGVVELKGLPEPVPVSEVAWEAAVAAALPLPPRLAVERSVAFVGRQEEQERLGQAWKTAQQGNRAVVLIGGEPGMGKTRLATETAMAAHRDGATVLLGTCDEDLAVPYQPFVEALRHYAAVVPPDRLAEGLGARAGELVRLVPELAERLPGLAPLQAADADTERYLLFEAVADFLAAASRDTPVVLFLDDLHWATKPTLLMLRHVVRASAATALLVLVTYRDADLTRTHPLTELLADLRRESGVERIPLRGLSDAEAVSLIETLAGHEVDDTSVALAQAVQAEVDGNPFFMREIVRNLVEAGAIRQENGRWTFGGDVDSLAIPESVREVIGRRLSRLSDESNHLLSLAAVIGRSFDLAVLTELAGIPSAAVIEAIEEAAAAALVREVPGSPGRYTFAHALVRHTLYDELSAARRMELHRAVGAALESLVGNRRDEYSAELAHHWLAATPTLGVTATDAAKAAEYAEQAAGRAMASLAYEEAVGHLDGALRVAALLGDGQRRARLLADLGEAQRCAGDPAHRETLLEAGRLALEQGDADLAGRAALANLRGQFSRFASVDGERITALEATLAALGPEDTAVRARLLASLASELHFTSDPRRHDLAAESLAIARRLDDPATLAHVLAAGWFARWDPGNLAERSEIADELSRLAAQVGDRILQFHAGVALYLTAAQRGDLDRADVGLEACARVADELGQPLLRWRVAYTRAGRAMAAGRLADAEQFANESLHLGEMLGLPDRLIYGQPVIAFVRLYQGRPREADALIRPLLEAFPIPACKAILAWCCAENDGLGEARALVESARGEGFDQLPRDYTWLIGSVVLAKVCALLCDPEMAEELHALLLPHRAEMVATQSIFVGSVAHYLGLLARSLGRLDDALADFETAAASQERIGSWAALVHTRLEWAETLLLRRGTGDVERAAELVAAAATGVRELGMTGLERRLAELNAQC